MLTDRCRDTLLCGRRFLQFLHPRFALIDDFVSFQVEVSSNDVGETRRGIAQLLQHRPSNRGLANICIVFQGLSCSSRGATRAFVARLVEIRFRDEDQRLDGHQDLEKGRSGVPFLFGSSMPGVQNAQTHFAVVVQIRVEANGVIARGLEIDRRRGSGIFVGKVDVEEKAAVGVRSAVGTGDQHAHDVHAVLVRANEDRRIVGERQRSGDGDLFLSEPFDALHGVDRQGVANQIFVMIFHRFVEQDLLSGFVFDGDRIGAELQGFHRLTVEFVQGDAHFRLAAFIGGVSLQVFLRFLLFLFDLVVDSLQFQGEEIQLLVVVDLNHRCVRLHAMQKVLDQTLDVARLVDQVLQLLIVQQTGD